MVIDPKFYGIAKTITEEIEGRCGDGGINLPKIGKIVSMAGAGDHIEIGTLFGASAIMAALVKQDSGYEGKVYCVDWFKGIEGDKSPVEEDKADATLDKALGNFEKFKVSDRIVIVNAPSYPLPYDLKDHRFVSALIDGEHRFNLPWLDFVSLRGKVDKFIMFDNFEEIYPDVVTAGTRALATGWFLHYKEGNFLSLRVPFMVKDMEKEWMNLREASLT